MIIDFDYETSRFFHLIDWKITRSYIKYKNHERQMRDGSFRFYLDFSPGVGHAGQTDT